MIETFRKLCDLLDGRGRRSTLLLLGLMLVMGLVEALGVASILPFVAVLSNPGLIHTNRYLSAAYKTLGFTEPSSFLIFLGAMTFLVVLGRIAFTALTSYATVRYKEMRSFALGTRLLESYMRRPYSWFLNHHSANMAKAVLSEADQVIQGSLMCALNLVSQVPIAAFLVALIVVVKPMVAVTTTVVLGVAYSLFYFSFRNYLGRIGGERWRMNRQRYQIAQEALAGIKEVKIGGLERAYMRRFSEVAYRFARRRATRTIIGDMPRYVLEAFAFGGILTVALVLLTNAGNDLSRVLPVLVLYTFAGLRLLPAIQKVYANLTSLKFSRVALDAVHADLTGLQGHTLLDARSKIRLPMRDCLELRGLTFTYPRAERPTLVDISLKITARTTVGFVGSTGAGKTTLVDIILGLLDTQRGELRVDGTLITADNVHDWQQAIGYVPQQIFLTDDTLAANIAFGMPPHKIDMQAVQQVCRMAELHEFVAQELPHGYATRVGERGVRLSGGQRQRVGIARALYHDPELLVLDEATSALDNLTERAVMDAIRNLAHRKTIIIIAHRLSTVRACDRLFLLEHGRLKASGNYNELVSTDQEFRQMAL